MFSMFNMMLKEMKKFGLEINKLLVQEGKFNGGDFSR